MKPGIYPDIPMAAYLAIPAVSAGVIRTIIEECPRAARYESFMNEDSGEEDADESSRKRKERGSVSHAVLLEGSESCLAIIDPVDHPNATKGKDGSYGIPDGWTNKSIKGARDDARARGLIPMLPHALTEIRQMVGEAQTYIESLRKEEPHIHAAFQPGGGRSEVTMLWMEGDTLCKLRADRLSNDNAITINYKTTGASVEPERWARGQLIGMGYYVDAAWYRRGIRAATGVDPTYVFLAQQVDRPYLCSLPGLDPSWASLGDEKVGAGLRLWQDCVAREEWPGFPARVCYPELPAYERARWEERNGVDEHGIPYDVSKLFQKKEAA